MSITRQPDGYRETIESGIRAVRRFGGRISTGIGTRAEQLKRLKREIQTADAIVIGAGAGLSTSAGHTYGGERFMRYFFDFAKEYGIPDMYSGGSYPFPDRETYWAYVSRLEYFNRYVDPEKPVYRELLDIVQGREYFAITTNVDHLFQKAGIDKSRLFYTQGDYGLFQSTNPDNRKTYDNQAMIEAMIAAQGFVKDDSSIYQVPEDRKISMRIPTELLPVCPDDGYPFTNNLRIDDTFLEDEGWQRASAAYAAFLEKYRDSHILFMELGVGGNTPVIIKYPFWQMTYDNPRAVIACLNYGEAFVPSEIKAQAICIDGDIGETLRLLK